MNKDNIIDALNKRATGYDYNEVVEEFGDGKDGGVTKRRINLKHMPPDITAIKMLLELEDEGVFDDLTDAELEKEKIRLINELRYPSKPRLRPTEQQP